MKFAHTPGNLPQRLVILLTLTACALSPCAIAAQDAGDADNLAPFGPQDVPPLAEGETRVLDAVIIDTRGRARWRPGEQGAWKAAAVDDMLKPGAEISTGTNASVTLRIGHNATIFVNGNTRFALPEVAQIGSTLRTRAGLQYGRADFNVERVGLTNDFQVVTPTTTLAVPGTGFSLIASALDGVQVVGVRGNMIRAIELSYFFRKIRVFLSGQGKSSSRYPDPVLAAMHDTLSPPQAWAAGLEAVGELENGFKQDLFGKETRQIEFGNEQQMRLQQDLFDEPDIPDQPDSPFGDFDSDEFFQLAQFICDHQSIVFSYWEDHLRENNLLRPGDFDAMRSEVATICEELFEREDPLFDIAFEIVSYCQGLRTTEQQNQCIVEFVESFNDVIQHYGPGHGEGRNERSNNRNRDGKRRRR